MNLSPSRILPFKPSAINNILETLRHMFHAILALHLRDISDTIKFLPLTRISACVCVYVLSLQ